MPADIKKTALEMYFKRKSREHIVKSLGISKYKLNRWITEACKGTKETSIYMFFSSNNRKQYICKELNIAEQKLNQWLDEFYECYEKKAVGLGNLQ